MAARGEARERRLVLLLLFQGAALLVVAFVPFGFDHRSSWGLDFGHLLVLAALYLSALLYGLALAVARRRWWLVLGQLGLPGSLAALAFTGVLAV